VGTDALNLLLMMLKYSASLAPKEEQQNATDGPPPQSLEAHQRLMALRQRFRQHAALAQLLRDAHSGKDL
jgi:hypothetical protein